MKKKNILVLMGGTSKEREVSLSSGEVVFQALSCIKDYNVSKYDLLNIRDFINFIKENDNIIVFNALHGGYGEDGRIPAILDCFKIPYTHSGVTASSLSMDKVISKKIAISLGIPTAKEQVINPKNIGKEKINIDYPLVVKPINEGSSFSIFMVFNEQDLNNTKKKLVDFDSIMIEKYIKGIECTVGVINGEALVVTEIQTNNSFYDYDAKYTLGKSKHIISPISISNELQKKIMNFSQDLYYSINAKGVIRVDYIIEETTNTPYFLEVNTHPGMTPTSLLPEQMLYVGRDFSGLCSFLIDSATYDN